MHHHNAGLTALFLFFLHIITPGCIASRFQSATTHHVFDDHPATLEELKFGYGPINTGNWGEDFVSSWRLANYKTEVQYRSWKDLSFTDSKIRPVDFENFARFGLERGIRRIFELTRSHALVLNYLKKIEEMVSQELTIQWRARLEQKDTADLSNPWNFSSRVEFYRVARMSLENVLSEIESKQGYRGYVNIIDFIAPNHVPTFEDLIHEGLLINDFFDFSKGHGINAHSVFPHRLQQALVILDFQNNPELYDNGKTPLDYYKALGDKEILNSLEWENEYLSLAGRQNKSLWGAMFDLISGAVPVYPNSLTMLSYKYAPILSFSSQSCNDGPWLRTKLWNWYKERVRESGVSIAEADEESEIQNACKAIDAQTMANHMICPSPSCRL